MLQHWIGTRVCGIWPREKLGEENIFVKNYQTAALLSYRYMEHQVSNGKVASSNRSY